MEKLVDCLQKGEKLLDVVDVVNGYFSESSKSYTLQIPFLKNFFIGYIGFLINGGAITPEEDLKIVQIIYSNIKNEDMNFNLERSQIRAYIVHELNMAGTSGNSKIDIVNVHEVYKSPAPQPEVPVEIDDNETVLADSSPYKMSPNSSRSWDTPSKSRLKIDASRANINMGVNAGPMTAPIYNAEILNRKMLDDQERLKLQIQASRPPLMHSQSVSNLNLSSYNQNGSPIPNPIPSNHSVPSCSPQLQNGQIPLGNNIVSSNPIPQTDNITPYQIAQQLFMARAQQLQVQQQAAAATTTAAAAATTTTDANSNADFFLTSNATTSATTNATPNAISTSGNASTESFS